MSTTLAAPAMPTAAPQHSMGAAPMEAATDPAAIRGLALLGLVYVFNFLDRNLILMQFGAIKTEFALGDRELAFLGTTSFVIFYTLLGVPFGRLADRVPRTKMIAAGLFT